MRPKGHTETLSLLASALLASASPVSAQTNAPVPEQPVLFMKATTAIGGANDDVVIPRGSVKTLP